MPPRRVVGHSLPSSSQGVIAHLRGSRTTKCVDHTRETVFAYFGILGVWAALSSHYVPPRRVVGHSLPSSNPGVVLTSESPEQPRMWTIPEKQFWHTLAYWVCGPHSEAIMCPAAILSKRDPEHDHLCVCEPTPRP